MNKKLSWLAAALYFLFMLGCYLLFSALSPPVRQQMASIHSLFWTFAMPVAAACCAVFALALRFIASLIAKRYSARSTS